MRRALAAVVLGAAAASIPGAAAGRGIGLSASPLRLTLRGASVAAITVRNPGRRPLLVDVSRAGFARSLHGKPRVRPARGTAAWLRLRPRRVRIAPGAKATLHVGARPAAAGLAGRPSGARAPDDAAARRPPRPGAPSGRRHRRPPRPGPDRAAPRRAWAHGSARRRAPPARAPPRQPRQRDRTARRRQAAARAPPRTAARSRHCARDAASFSRAAQESRSSPTADTSEGMCWRGSSYGRGFAGGGVRSTSGCERSSSQMRKPIQRQWTDVSSGSALPLVPRSVVWRRQPGAEARSESPRSRSGAWAAWPGSGSPRS